MRIHFLEHVPFEDAANVGAWARERGHSVSRTLFSEGEPLPSLDAFDWLAVMGGPMNIYEHERYPWLAEEKKFLKAAIDGGKPVVGICLGAQLAADVLGGRVTRNPHTEIGWFPIALTDAGRQAVLFEGCPAEFLAFHWHGDTFSIPPGAVHLARSEACRNQAFSYQDRVFGLQFHLDYCTESIDKMLRHCGDELVPGPFVQSAEAIRASYDQVDVTSELLWGMLDRLCRTAD